MANQQSCECTNTGLDLFTIPPTQTSIEHGFYVESHPLATITDNGPLEFTIKGSGEDYIDLSNTYLHIQSKITKPDGTDLSAEDDLVTPVNNFLHALFTEVNVSLNGVLVSTSTNTYAFRSYIENLLNYGNDAKQTQLALSMYYNDVPNGVDARRKRVKGSRLMDMIGRIHADIFTQEKYLLSNVDVRLRFIRSKDAFSVLAKPLKDGEPTPGYKVKIVHASLFVRKIRVNPAIVLAHEKALQTATAKYPIKRIMTRVFSAPQNNMNIVQDNLFLNQRPNRIVIGLVDSKAFNGEYETSPFNFKHHNLNTLALYLDGQQIPSKALKPDFENGIYARSYFSLFAGTGIIWKDATNSIQYDDFGDGYTLFCFDLTPSIMDGDRRELIKTGTLRLEIGFAKPLPNPIHVLTYAEFDGVIEIDRARQVLCDFST